MHESMDERHKCPHCHRDTGRKPYLMSTRSADPIVDPYIAIGWTLAIALILVILSRV